MEHFLDSAPLGPPPNIMNFQLFAALATSFVRFLFLEFGLVIRGFYKVVIEQRTLHSFIASMVANR